MQKHIGTQKECIILKRKVIAAVMALICILSMSACSSDKKPGTGSTDGNTENGVINDMGDVAEDAGDAVSDAGNAVSDAESEASSKAKDTMDNIKEDMSTKEASSGANKRVL